MSAKRSRQLASFSTKIRGTWTSGGSGFVPCSEIFASISLTTRSASASRPLVASQRGDQDPDRKDRLEDEDEAAALLGLGELVHIGEGDWDLAAKSDALDEAKNHERIGVPRKGAGDAQDRDHPDRPGQRPQPPKSLGNPAEEDAADHLSDITARDQEADLRRAHVPQAYQHRQDERDDERIECVEKRRAAD